MPLPPGCQDRGLSSKPLPTLLSYDAVRSRIQTQSSAPAADLSTSRRPPHYDIRAPPPSPFYIRPSSSPASAPNPNSAHSSSTQTPSQAAPHPNPSTPVAIINGYLGTSTTYPEAWPLSWLALTKSSRSHLQGHTRHSQPLSDDNINTHLAANFAYPSLDDNARDSSDGEPHAESSSQPQTSQAWPEHERQEEGLREEGEQLKPSLGRKHFLRPERHRGELYTEIGSQGMKKGNFDIEYMEHLPNTGSRSVRSIPLTIGRREAPDTSLSIMPAATTILTISHRPPLPHQPQLYRVVNPLTLTMHNERDVRVGKLVALIRELDDGWMVEDSSKQESMLARQLISDHPVPKHTAKDDNIIRVSTTALSSITMPRTVVSDHSELERNDGSGGSGGDDDYVQATAAALSPLSSDDEPKDQIIDLLGQIIRGRKAASTHVIADMVAANEAIEARARRAAEIDEETDRGAGEQEWGARKRE